MALNIKSKIKKRPIISCCVFPLLFLSTVFIVGYIFFGNAIGTSSIYWNEAGGGRLVYTKPYGRNPSNETPWNINESDINTTLYGEGRRDYQGYYVLKNKVIVYTLYESVEHPEVIETDLHLTPWGTWVKERSSTRQFGSGEEFFNALRLYEQQKGLNKN